MIEIMRFATVTVLGSLCAWLAKRYLENFDDKWNAALLAFAVMCFIAFLVDLRNDLREARERQSSAENQQDQISPEN